MCQGHAFLSISLGFLLILSIFFLGGCKKKTEEKTFVPRLDTQSKCKIEIAGRYQNFEALEAEFDRFNEFYPNVELSYTYLDNYKVTISTALAGEDAPDIFMTFPWMLDKTNFDPLLENAENLADSKLTGIELSAVNQKLLFYMDNGSLPMVPVLCAANGMLVNEDLFKKEGIEIPQNWSQLVDACQKLKDAGYKSPQHLPNISAHIIRIDSLTGFSNRPKIDNPEEFTVSYKEIDIFSSLNELLGQQDQVRVTLQYRCSKAFQYPQGLYDAGELIQPKFLRVLQRPVLQPLFQDKVKAPAMIPRIYPY